MHFLPIFPTAAQEFFFVLLFLLWEHRASMRKEDSLQFHRLVTSHWLFFLLGDRIVVALWQLRAAKKCTIVQNSEWAKVLPSWIHSTNGKYLLHSKFEFARASADIFHPDSGLACLCRSWRRIYSCARCTAHAMRQQTEGSRVMHSASSLAYVSRSGRSACRMTNGIWFTRKQFAYTTIAA